MVLQSSLRDAKNRMVDQVMQLPSDTHQPGSTCIKLPNTRALNTLKNYIFVCGGDGVLGNAIVVRYGGLAKLGCEVVWL